MFICLHKRVTCIDLLRVIVIHAHTWTTFGVAWLFNKTLSLQALSLNVESVHDRDRVPPPQLTEHVVQGPHPPITIISLCLIMRHMVHRHIKV